MVVSAAAASVWDRIAERGELRCAGLNQQPFSWKISDNDYRGFVPEICRALVQDLSQVMGKDLKLTFVPTTWATIVLDVQSGRIDVAAALSPTEERKKSVDMPGPAYFVATGVIYRKGFEPLPNWADYNKPEIMEASISGSVSEQVAQQKIPKAEHLALPDFASVLLAIQSSRVDISIEGFVAAVMAMKDNGPIFGGFIVPEPRIDNPSHFALQKDGDGRMADWIQTWSDKAREEGRINLLIRKAVLDTGISVDDIPDMGNLAVE